eukprot:CAMPEP_0172564534 /NCGR_PEP_ID=MMETSP1067-20121228/104748_1 /TAXON_ID=265564 ORGANISM="Thalassiosira punctigera, Strain Tpunct2005C2" /NCGR_SAMPLE_ID=MMETSP1067 /ASSEMBLY_ACC=CAM_ASM_000444 /LENGTH=60 /DNA_ID=CAMNT_0013355227 /DNA_START=50 /DNA_END=228 /DNA_ORIENTATION=+
MMIVDEIFDAISDADFDVDFKGVFTILMAMWTTSGIYTAVGTYWNDYAASPLAKPAVRLL